MIKRRKPLPKDIQFTFNPLQDPVCIEILLTMNVFMGPESAFGNEPVVYAVNLVFFKDDAADQYVFQSLKLDGCYHLAPYNQEQLELKLVNRLNEILEHCTLRVDVPIKEQLSLFLEEYGGYERARFLL